MGLNRTARNTATLVGVGLGKDDKGRPQGVFSVGCTKDTPDAVAVLDKDGAPVMDKNGNPKFRLEFTDITGYIRSFKKQEREVATGKMKSFLVITMEDDGLLYDVSIEVGSQYWADFLMRLPYVDPKQKVKLAPTRIVKDDRASFYMVVYQKEKMERAFRKDNEYTYEGVKLPAAEEKTINREKVWDFTLRDEALEVVLEQFNAKLDPFHSEAPAANDIREEPPAQGGPAGQPSVAAASTEEDDLPF